MLVEAWGNQQSSDVILNGTAKSGAVTDLDGRKLDMDLLTLSTCLFDHWSSNEEILHAN